MAVNYITSREVWESREFTCWFAHARRQVSRALAELICRVGDEAGTKSAALLVLMSTLETASHPKALANLAKHLAFTRCGELNFNGVVEAQIAVFESELLADDTLVS